MIDEAQRTAMPAADDRNEPGATRTVRDAVFDVMRRFGMTTIFGNPSARSSGSLTSQSSKSSASRPTVPAGLSGTISEIVPENGPLVEYGEPLFRVKPAG